MPVITARKKPVVIEAIRFDGSNQDEIKTFGAPYVEIIGVYSELISIQSLEGNMIGNIGDWIIKGVNGEFYPCKPDIFAKTYNVIGESS